MFLLSNGTYFLDVPCILCLIYFINIVASSIRQLIENNNITYTYDLNNTSYNLSYFTVDCMLKYFVSFSCRYFLKLIWNSLKKCSMLNQRGNTGHLCIVTRWLCEQKVLVMTSTIVNKLLLTLRQYKYTYNINGVFVINMEKQLMFSESKNSYSYLTDIMMW